jgi:hypothetical protein
VAHSLPQSPEVGIPVGHGRRLFRERSSLAVYRVLGDPEKEGRVKKKGRQYFPGG